MSASCSAASTRRSYSMCGSRTRSSPPGVVTRVARAIVRSSVIGPSAWADLQYGEHRAVLVKNHAPVTNPQPISCSPLQLADVVCQAGRIGRIELDLVADGPRRVGRHPSDRPQGGPLLCVPTQDLNSRLSGKRWL